MKNIENHFNIKIIVIPTLKDLAKGYLNSLNKLTSNKKHNGNSR